MASRSYSYQATNATIEALRLLREPWISFAIDEQSLTVRLSDESLVRVGVETEEAEPGFDVTRITARTDEEHGGIPEPAADFGLARNDVVLFTGLSWTEDAPSGERAVMFHGHPMMQPESFEALCTTTDAIVIASSTGEGILLRVGLRPGTIEAIPDRAEIARFLLERGYK